MAVSYSLWTDEEVDILVEAYANALKRSSPKFLTSNDWTNILHNINRNKVGVFRKKNISQIKNKKDAIVKLHKKEQEKQLGGVPSSWKYFNTMEELYLIKYGNINCQTNSEDFPKSSHSDEVNHEQCTLKDSGINQIKSKLELCDNFLSEVEYMFSLPDVEEDSIFIRSINNDYEYECEYEY